MKLLAETLSFVFFNTLPDQVEAMSTETEFQRVIWQQVARLPFIGSLALLIVCGVILTFCGTSLSQENRSMRKYHHLGIPTTTKRGNETFLENFKVYVSGYETSPYGIEWMRYEPECQVPELVKTVPHVAFEVDDLEAELAGKNVLIEPNSPSEGVLVAFIVDDGAPVEFIQFTI